MIEYTVQDVSLAFSVIALGISMMSAFYTWRSLRNAVTPHCQFLRNTTRSSSQAIGIYLQNKGPGIAIIKKWRFVFHEGTEEEKEVSPQDAARALSLKAFTPDSELDVGKKVASGERLPVIFDSRAWSGTVVAAEDEMYCSRLCQLNIYLTYACVNGSTRTIEVKAHSNP